MGQSLTEIAQQLSTARTITKKVTTDRIVETDVPKVQLIYAFNGTGKTRLSREFKQVIAPTLEGDDHDDGETTEPSASNVLYYNAFTEDLFYWDNDLINNAQPKLKIRHCCKVSDEAAFCLIQRPYISKTLLTRRISPRGSP